MNLTSRKIMRLRLLEYRGYKNRQIKLLNYKKQIVGNLFSLMPVIVMTIFIFVAFIIGLTYMQFSGELTPDNSGLTQSSFWNNLQKLGKDKDFVAAIKNTLIYSAVVVSGALLWSLILASLLNLTKIRGKKLFLVGFFLPQVTSEVASTIIFIAMLRKSMGVADNPANWFWIMAIIGVWVATSSSLVIFNTAFANIGKTEYEAASLDGASPIVKFLKITLPALAPIIAFQLIMLIIFGMTSFGASYVMINMEYVIGEDKTNIILWPVLGFIRVTGVSGYQANVGLGMIELFILGFSLVFLTVIANYLQPIQGRK